MYYFGFVIEEIFELGPTTKACCLDLDVLTLWSQLLDLHVSSHKLPLNPSESTRYLFSLIGDSIDYFLLSLDLPIGNHMQNVGTILVTKASWAEKSTFHSLNATSLVSKSTLAEEALVRVFRN